MEGEIAHYAEEYILQEIGETLLAATKIVGAVVSIFEGPKDVATEIFVRKISRLLPGVSF